MKCSHFAQSAPGHIRAAAGVSPVSATNRKAWSGLSSAVMEKIADDVEKDPKDRNKVRKLANHYTSMIEELVEKYINLESQGQGGENISSAMDEIKKGLETVENAVKSLLDGLFSDDAMEVSADISVLEQLFKTEGAENRMDFDSAEKE